MTESRDRLTAYLFQVFQPGWTSELVQYARPPDLRRKGKSGCQISTDPSGGRCPRDSPSTYLLVPQVNLVSPPGGEKSWEP